MRYLTFDDVLKLHTRAIREAGGSEGIRDAGAMESAVSQPIMSFAEQELYPTISEKSAALGFSLISNHPFVDGNKRIGHAAMEVFLLLNGYEIDADIDEQEQAVLAVAAGTMSREEWTVWVQNHVVKGSQTPK